ncbi:MAG: hypothetical protein ACR2GY_06180 [Phycisphaerales bacterium]
MMHVLAVTILIVIGSVEAPEEHRTASEIIRGVDGVCVTYTNAGLVGRFGRTVLYPIEEGEDFTWRGDLRSDEQFALFEGHVDIARLGGPIGIGRIGVAIYWPYHWRAPDITTAVGGHQRLSSTKVDVSINHIDFVPLTSMTKNQVEEKHSFKQAHASMCKPLMDYIKQRPEELYNNWDITFDYVYTTLDDVTVLMLRQGQMHRWTLHGTGWEGEGPYNPDWQTHAPFDTNIEGVFRMFMAGPELANHYIIDETGAIYTGYDRDHRQIGTFLQYHSPRETTLTIIFEDQMTQKIAVVHATEEGEITLLPINWRDESFANDFITTELDETQTAGIRRLAEAMREDAGGEE